MILGEFLCGVLLISSFQHILEVDAVVDDLVIEKQNPFARILPKDFILLHR